MLPILHNDNRLTQVPSLLNWAFPELSDSQIALPLDISEDDENYYFSLDLPGVKREDITLTIKNNVLQIKGERNKVITNNKELRSERWAGNFSRTIKLPAQLDCANIKAELKDGVLNVVITKTENSKTRIIDIK